MGPRWLSMRPTMHTNLPSDTTSTPTGPTRSTRDFLDTPTLRDLRSQRPSIPLTSLTPRTGEPRVPSPQLRTRDNADHAGPSPPLVPLRVPCSTSTAHSTPSLSNNWLTAPRKTTVAMVDSWTMLSCTLRTSHLCSRLTMHTTPERELANMSPPRVRELFPPTTMSAVTRAVPDF